MEMVINWSDEFEDHITVTDDNGVEYQYNASVKRDNVTAEVIMTEIRRFEYPDMPNLDTLETWEQWIADGCWIDEETQAEKVEWTNKHPVETESVDRKKISGDTADLLRNAVNVLDLKEYLKKVHQIK